MLRETNSLGLKKVIEIGANDANVLVSRLTGWKKKSIFWDLTFWNTNLIRHNLDVMHIEKNVFENIFNIVMNVDGKTKDNAKSRLDLMEICRRLELHVVDDKFPKACYTLDKNGRNDLCIWVRNIRFPNGYASNMAKCVDVRKH